MWLKLFLHFPKNKQFNLFRCPLSLFCAGICCPTAGRGPNGGRSAPSSGGHYDNADKYTQQRHQFMGGEQNAGGGICQSMTCNTVIPSFHELPHTVSASSFYPTQTGGYNSCFSIDKCKCPIASCSLYLFKEKLCNDLGLDGK